MMASALTAGLIGCTRDDAPADTASQEAVGQTDPDGIDEEAPMRSEAELERRLEVRQRAVQKQPERYVEPPPTHVTGEVPDSLLATVKEDLAGKLGIGADAIDVVRGESIVWNDGSMGCPRPDTMYTQALVPGYWIILAHGGKEYDYRASERGSFFLCELPMTLEPSDELE